MEDVTVIGVDLAKRVFHLHGASRYGGSVAKFSWEYGTACQRHSYPARALFHKSGCDRTSPFPGRI